MGLIGNRVHNPMIMDPQTFEALGGFFGHRVLHQEVDPCPNGESGCLICQAPGQKNGQHPQPMVEEEVSLEWMPVLFDGTQQGLPHRFRSSSVTLERSDGVVLREGVDFTLEGRRLVSSSLAVGETVTARYSAYPEIRALMSHTTLFGAGGKARAEETLQLAYAQLDQGQLALTLHPEDAGFDLKDRDRFISVEGRMRFNQVFIPDEHPNGRAPARHRFLHKVVKAYRLNRENWKIEPFAVEFDAEHAEWTFAPEEDSRPVVVVYDAAPIYFVYRDAGEFRAAKGEIYPRLVLLSRDPGFG